MQAALISLQIVLRMLVKRRCGTISRFMALDETEDPYCITTHPLLVIISGPSGVGKDTLLQFMKDRGHDFSFVVTMTSRAKRASEVEGRDYFFVTRPHFESLIACDELIEHSIVYGEYKGIPKAQVRKAFASGKDVVMRIDVQGAHKIKAMVPNAVTIFLMPDSERELIRRLRDRKTESEAGLRKRIDTAHSEMRRKMEFDYCVVNHQDAQDAAVDQILGIIHAEHCRTLRKPALL